LLVPNPGSGGRFYDPLREHSGLFKTFAATEPSEAAILSFADKYGSLGLAHETGSFLNLGIGMVPDAEFVAPFSEFFEAWKSEIELMRSLTSLWTAVRESDQRTLQKFVAWQLDSVSCEVPGFFGSKTLAARWCRPELFSRLRAGDVITPSLCFVQDVINEQLQIQRVHPRLLWDSRLMNLGLRMVPTSLIGCLWLQFAKAVEGHKEYRQCEVCRKWFEVGGSRTARADKRFCSPTCKAKAHRKKRDEALRLFQQLVPVREIARQLDTDLETVKGWVRQ
jgi:hypothetical protein